MFCSLPDYTGICPSLAAHLLVFWALGHACVPAWPQAVPLPTMAPYGASARPLATCPLAVKLRAALGAQGRMGSPHTPSATEAHPQQSQLILEALGAGNSIPIGPPWQGSMLAFIPHAKKEQQVVMLEYEACHAPRETPVSRSKSTIKRPR